MARGRSLKTEADFRRAIKQKFGLGERENYRPWLRVQDVKSHGNRTQIQGKKLNRIHHLMSLIEAQFFYIAEFHDSVIDIREQFPILPLSFSNRVADSLDIKHPRHPTSKFSIVLTTDFLLTIQTDCGESLLAVSVKPAEKLSDRRTLEKLELERACWELLGVNFKLFTSNEHTFTQSENIAWSTTPFRNESCPSFSDLQISSALDELQPGQRLICDICESFIIKNITDHDHSLLLLKYLIMRKLIKVDMSVMFIETGILDIFEVAHNSLAGV